MKPSGFKALRGRLVKMALTALAFVVVAAGCGEFSVPNLTPAEVSDPAAPSELQSSVAESPSTSTVVVQLEDATGTVDGETAGGATTGSEVTTAETAGAEATPSTIDPAIPVPTSTDEWRQALASSGRELPGGGIEVFPDRRLVANYGSPATSRLGVMGERSFDGNVVELLALAEQYRTPGSQESPSPAVMPSLEIIVSVATAEAGGDGDYSKYLAKYKVRRWVDAAAEAGVYVILDLQPGRTDFVTQAKWFEEFLRQPHVGLALDPEWRIGPDEVHLRRIGSVDAAEVNAVVDYLVGLVYEEVLPQKILVLHQFNRSMLPDRELIRTPPELAVVVHVDGQGPLGSKYGTWDDIVGQPIGPDQTLWWGWKNFYDEDTPVATPSQVNQVTPLPVLVTYQ